MVVLHTNRSMVALYVQVFKRHVASDRMVSGAYKTEYGEAEEIQEVSNRIQVWSLIQQNVPHFIEDYTANSPKSYVQLRYQKFRMHEIS